MEAMHSEKTGLSRHSDSPAEDSFQQLLLRLSSAAAAGSDSHALIRLFCQATREFFRVSGSYFWELLSADEMVGREASGFLEDRFPGTRVKLIAAHSAGAARSSLLFASDRSGDQAYLAAVALINDHRYEEAIASLHRAERAFGPHPDILTYLGFANRKLKRYAEAEAYYRQALAIAPHHRGALEYYGELMVERGDTAGARQNLALLDQVCTFGCYEAEELRRWIASGHGLSS